MGDHETSPWPARVKRDGGFILADKYPVCTGGNPEARSGAPAYKASLSGLLLFPHCISS